MAGTKKSTAKAGSRPGSAAAATAATFAIRSEAATVTAMDTETATTADEQQQPSSEVVPEPESALESAKNKNKLPAADEDAGAHVAMEVDDNINSRKVTLADFCARAGALYSQKKYDDATDLYSRAAEMQDELLEENDPERAEILFLYSRSLFMIGQAKSDVLGDKAPAGATGEDIEKSAEEIEEAGVRDAANKKGSLVQFNGDSGLCGNDEEMRVDGVDEGNEEETETELETAFHTFEIAAQLFRLKLEGIDEAPSSDKGNEVPPPNQELTRHIRERLADTHGYLAEIAMENDRYIEAITDCRAALKYRREIDPEESTFVAEAHYKLSLALELASVTQPAGDDANDVASSNKLWDQDFRDEAVLELQAAIASQNTRLKAKEVELATMASPEDNYLTKQEIAEVKDIIGEMKARLKDLRTPPIDFAANLSSLISQDSPLRGILAIAKGKSAAEFEAAVELARRSATDLTGFVRKKNTEEPPEAASAVAHDADGNGKRKADEDETGSAGSGSEAKKVRVDNV